MKGPKHVVKPIIQLKKRRPIWLQYSCVLWLSHTFNIFSVNTAGMNKLKIRNLYWYMKSYSRFSWVIKKTQRIPGKEWTHNRERFWIRCSFVAFIQTVHANVECTDYPCVEKLPTNQRLQPHPPPPPSSLVSRAAIAVHCNRITGPTDFRNGRSDKYFLKKDYTPCSYHVMSTLYNTYTIFLTHKDAILKFMWVLQNMYVHCE